jgi:hypothetical protein
MIKNRNIVIKDSFIRTVSESYDCQYDSGNAACQPASNSAGYQSASDIADRFRTLTVPRRLFIPALRQLAVAQSRKIHQKNHN